MGRVVSWARPFDRLRVSGLEATALRRAPSSRSGQGQGERVGCGGFGGLGGRAVSWARPFDRPLRHAQVAVRVNGLEATALRRDWGRWFWRTWGGRFVALWRGVMLPSGFAVPIAAWLLGGDSIIDGLEPVEVIDGAMASADGLGGADGSCDEFLRGGHRIADRLPFRDARGHGRR